MCVRESLCVAMAVLVPEVAVTMVFMEGTGWFSSGRVPLVSWVFILSLPTSMHRCLDDDAQKQKREAAIRQPR